MVSELRRSAEGDLARARSKVCRIGIPDAKSAASKITYRLPTLPLPGPGAGPILAGTLGASLRIGISPLRRGSSALEDRRTLHELAGGLCESRRLEMWQSRRTRPGAAPSTAPPKRKPWPVQSVPRAKAAIMT